MKTAGAIVLGAASGALAGALVLGAWILTRPDLAAEGNQAPQAEAMPVTSAALPLSAPTPVSNEAPPAFAASPAEPMHHDDPARDRQQAIHKNETRWNADLAAPAQATQLEQKLLSVATTEGVSAAHYQPTRLGVQCKASMCRLESDYALGADGDEWATRMLIGMAGTIGHSEFVQEPLPGGGQRMVLYAYRLGHEPPH